MRRVGIPTLILTALWVLTSLGVAIIVGIVHGGPDWILGALPCVGGPVLFIVFGVLNIVWLVRRGHQAKPEASPDEAPASAPPATPRVSFLWSVFVPAVLLVAGWFVTLLLSTLVLPHFLQPGGPGMRSQRRKH